MTTWPDHKEVPALPSATVMMARDGRDGIEVFMVLRTRPVDGAMGAVVFPGGKIDPDDAAPEIARGAPATSSPSYWVAAVRETFEEAGVLIASGGGDAASSVSPDRARAVVAAHREPLLARKIAFSKILAGAGLRPDFGSMVHFAHWQTPQGLPKRFDTHFFLVRAPDGQEPTPDGQEMASCLWTTPAGLIAEADAGRQTLVPATRFNLDLLGKSRTVADAMAAARARKVVMVLPRREVTADGPRMVIPAEAGYGTTWFPSRRG